MTPEQEYQIYELLYLREDALRSIFADTARDMAAVVADEWIAALKRDGYTITIDADTIAERVKGEYLKSLNKGGSVCVERVIEQNTNGKHAGQYKTYTRESFVPWLDDMVVSDANRIITTISDAENAGIHPRTIAKMIKDDFTAQNHNAMTAARTESSKIRNDARSESFNEAGVKYVRYVTAGDDRVRPEHEQRNGKIYRHDNSPWLGEYNCRCVLVPADYEVKYKGAKVSKDHVEYLTEEQVNTTAGQVRMRR